MLKQARKITRSDSSWEIPVISHADFVGIYNIFRSGVLFELKRICGGLTGKKDKYNDPSYIYIASDD